MPPWSAPWQLKWSKWLNYSGVFLSMRVDTKPFDDIRVRRALNLFSWVHSVDDLDLLARIDRIAQELGRRPRILHGLGWRCRTHHSLRFRT